MSHLDVGSVGRLIPNDESLCIFDLKLKKKSGKKINQSMVRLELGLNYRGIKHVNTDSQSVD